MLWKQREKEVSKDTGSLLCIIFVRTKVNLLTSHNIVLEIYNGKAIQSTSIGDISSTDGCSDRLAIHWLDRELPISFNFDMVLS